MPRPKRPANTLTHRQLEIVRLLSTGDEDKMIAHKLGLCLNTVQNHLFNIRQITGTNNRVQLAVWFIRDREVA